jgi:hypothetical protein
LHPSKASEWKKKKQKNGIQEEVEGRNEEVIEGRN